MKADATILKHLQQRIHQSEQKAFEDLYRIFFPRLYNFAKQYVHTKEAAEEIVNDIMVKIWEKRLDICSIANIETYLFTAIRNHSLNYLQKYSHYHITVADESNVAAVVNMNDPQKELEWKEITSRLNAAIEHLPEQCRTVFKLIKEEGFKYRQVAEILGISPRTVETQLVRAMKKLNQTASNFLDNTPLKAGSRSHVFSLFLLLSVFY